MLQKPYIQISPQPIKLLTFGWQNVILGAFPSNFARVKWVEKNLWAPNAPKLSVNHGWVWVVVLDWLGDPWEAWGDLLNWAGAGLGVSASFCVQHEAFPMAQGQSAVSKEGTGCPAGCREGWAG